MKYIKQIILYSIELAIIILLGIFITAKLGMLSNNIQGIILNNIPVIIGIYELGLYLMFSLSDDAKKDMYIAYQKFLKQIEIYIDAYIDGSMYDRYSDKEIFYLDKDRFKNYLYKFIEMQTDSKTFNDKDILDRYQSYQKKISNDSIALIDLKLDLIDIENRIEMLDLKWRLSIALRFLK